MWSSSVSRVGSFIASLCAAGAIACSSGSGPIGLYGDGGTDQGGKNGQSNPPSDTVVVSAEGGTKTDGSCTSKYPASQSLSQPCCTERGPDACGAGLFCAAFDGRTQPTCYAEHSRTEGQTCTADVQCVNNNCDETGVCKKPTAGMCPATCTLDSQCQASCPKSGSAIACCDTTTGVCYQSNNPQCPIK